MALEELEMALRREEQERSQRISAETLLSNRLEILMSLYLFFWVIFRILLDCFFMDSKSGFHCAYKEPELYPYQTVYWVRKQVFNSRQENGSTTESGETGSSTAYPNSASEPSAASKLLMQGNEGEVRMEHCELVNVALALLSLRGFLIWFGLRETTVVVQVRWWL